MKRPPTAADSPPATAPPAPVDETVRGVPVPPTAPVSPMAAQVPAPTPPEDSGRRRRVVLLAVVGVLLIALGAVGLVLALGDDEPERSKTARSGQSDDESSQTASSATEESPTESTSASASASVPSPPEFKCWDGSSADTLSACGTPTGVAGMHWIFPQSSEPGCSRSSRAQRLTEIDCRRQVQGGGEVRLHFTEWVDLPTGRAQYANQDVLGPPDVWRGFTRWYVSPRRGPWSHKVALLYRGQPWSVTIYGSSAADRDQGMRELRFRPAAQISGKPSP